MISTRFTSVERGRAKLPHSGFVVPLKSESMSPWQQAAEETKGASIYHYAMLFMLTA